MQFKPLLTKDRSARYLKPDLMKHQIPITEEKSEYIVGILEDDSTERMVGSIPATQNSSVHETIMPKA